MNNTEITPEIRKKAETCQNCPVCQKARRDQKGFAYWFVKNIEGSFCPYCQSYELVHGRKAHEPQRTV
jgi:hypothetical protein